MAAKKVLDLLVDIEAKGIQTLDKAYKAFDKLEKKSFSASKGIKAFASASSNIASKMQPIVIGLSAVTAGFMLTVKGSLKAADQIVKTSNKIGTSTKVFQELKSASGMGMEAFSKSMEKFSGQVTAAKKGTGELSSEFAKYGISLMGAGRATASVESVMNRFADLIKRAPTDVEKARLATIAFGEAGPQMVLALKNGSKGLELLKQKARETGQVIDGKLLQSAAKTSQAFDALTEGIKTKFMEAVLKMGPAIQKISLQMITFLPYLGKILDAIIPYMPVLIPLIGGITTLGLAFLTVVNPIIQFMAVIVPLLEGLGLATLAVPALIAALVALAGYLVAMYLKVYQPEIFELLANIISDTFESMKQDVIKVYEFIVGVINKIKDAIFGAPADISSKSFFTTGGVPTKKREGGHIPGYGGGDKVSALLEAGEFVIRKEMVRKFGMGTFAALNSGRFPDGRMRFAEGGPVPSPAQNNSFNFSAPITANGTGMEEVFRNSIIPELKKAFRNNTGSITTLLRKVR